MWRDLMLDLALELNCLAPHKAPVESILYIAPKIAISRLTLKLCYLARLVIGQRIELSCPVLSLFSFDLDRLNDHFFLICEFSEMRLTIFVTVEGRWTVLDELWQWTGEEEIRLMVIDESIPLRELQDRIFEKFGINKEEFNLKLSFCAKSRRTSGPSCVRMTKT